MERCELDGVRPRPCAFRRQTPAWNSDCSQPAESYWQYELRTSKGDVAFMQSLFWSLFNLFNLLSSELSAFMRKLIYRKSRKKKQLNVVKARTNWHSFCLTTLLYLFLFVFLIQVDTWRTRRVLLGRVESKVIVATWFNYAENVNKIKLIFFVWKF